MSKPRQTPNPLTDPFVPALAARALVAAVSVGLFTALGRSIHNAQALAQAVQLAPDGVQQLLSVLEALGYVEAVEGGYRLTKASDMTLTPKSPMPLIHWVRFCRTQQLAADHLEAGLQGRPVDLTQWFRTEQDRILHQRAMAETAGPIAKWVAQSIPLHKDATRMLDVGGAHGLYAAALCQRSPSMQADILEQPEMIAAAEVVAKELGTDRVAHHLPGDLHHLPQTRSYDLVFLGNLLHHLRPTEGPDAVAELAALLRPGGTLAIWDLDLSDSAPDLTAACFSLFFYLTSGARCYRRNEIAAWIQAAGLEQFNVFTPDGTGTHALFVARKQ